jgi:hypothetical protein
VAEQEHDPTLNGAPWRTAGESRDFFSILLEEVADQLDRLFWRRDGMDQMRCEVFE